MSLDLTLLDNVAPAPWHAEMHEPTECNNEARVYAEPTETDPSFWVADCGLGEDGEVKAAFVALARNALDVMLRRPWGVECVSWSTEHGSHSFRVVDELDRPVNDGRSYADPYSALVEADRWYKANVKD